MDGLAAGTLVPPHHDDRRAKGRFSPHMCPSYMSSMFLGAAAFNQNIGTWNTGAVTNMSSMFWSAAAFNQNIGTWNTAAVNHTLVA